MVNVKIEPQGVRCPVCGTAAELLQSDVKDEYFGHPGAWTYYQCSAADCRSAFPVPAVSDQELLEAYGRYYTHVETAYGRGAKLRDRIVARLMPNRVVADRTVAESFPGLDYLYEQFAFSLGGRRALASGSVLDVGCGNGDRLERFEAIGWGKATGVEYDIEAVRLAVARGRVVEQGVAEALPVASESQDLVFLHHVIEHVRDPNAALSEALRVLKPGGDLFVVTPNIDSGLRYEAGPRWRGFEAPRHLVIFTPRGLRRLADQLGFVVTMCRTSSRSAAWMRSVSLQRPAKGLTRFWDTYRQYRSQKRMIDEGQDVGDEIVLAARKPAG